MECDGQRSHRELKWTHLHQESSGTEVALPKEAERSWARDPLTHIVAGVVSAISPKEGSGSHSTTSITRGLWAA